MHHKKLDMGFRFVRVRIKGIRISEGLLYWFNLTFFVKFLNCDKCRNDPSYFFTQFMPNSNACNKVLVDWSKLSPWTLILIEYTVA